MIEWAGTLYTLGKELYGYFKDGKELYATAKEGYDAVKSIENHFEVKEGEPKHVDFEWVSKSGFQSQLEGEGYRRDLESAGSGTQDRGDRRVAGPAQQGAGLLGVPHRGDHYSEGCRAL